jgi:hypothetical protein
MKPACLSPTLNKALEYCARHLACIIVLCVALFAATRSWGQQGQHIFYSPEHPAIQYTGRIDFTNPKLPRFWQPGVYIEAVFTGKECEIILNDEMLWGVNHNYLQIVVDGVTMRIQTKSRRDTIKVIPQTIAFSHSLLICKNTEANIGWLELVGLRCESLLAPPPKPLRRMEFIGNSITCGTGSDQSSIACGKGVWHDQHNAYLSYGAITARTLNAQYHLSAVSGIGLIHSCCNMNVIMPQVYDKVSMRNDTISWNFSNYQPDVVTVCLGQNDGKQDSAIFSASYLAFLARLRTYYPAAEIICITSPMADQSLSLFMRTVITGIVKEAVENGDQKVSSYFFTKQFSKGCDWHPDLSEHAEIAAGLVSYIKSRMKW